MNRWFAVSASGEVAHGAVAHSQLLGQELVLWRSTSGMLNAWENRCPHRGVRLTIGSCVGEELRCQYHAWRFASGSGQCTHIPAHPGQKPASTIRPAVFSVFEDGTFAWVSLARDEAPPAPAVESAGTALRSIFTAAPVAVLREALLAGYPDHRLSARDEFTVDANAGSGPALQFMLHPVSESASLLHARLHGAVSIDGRLALLRHHNALMTQVRDRAEAAVR